MKDCPVCGSHVDGLVCPRCKHTEQPRRAKTGLSEDQETEIANRMLDDRQRFQAGAKDSFSLTDQQWYNVCKYFPSVARRCRRPMEDVSSDNPLDEKSSAGMLAQLKAPRFRQPGEDDE